MFREIAFNRVCEEIKQRMESNKEFDYSKAFHSIDDWSYGYIDRKNLKSFLRKHGHLATNEEVMSIIRRMDMDADARISKQEFIESVKPEEPYSKMMKRITQSAQKRKNVSFNHSKNASKMINKDDLLKLTDN